MKAVKLWGGLGNQMFQYAFGIYLSKKYGCNVSFYPHFGISASECSINVVVKNITFLSEEEQRSMSCYYKNLLHYRIERKMAQKIPFLYTKLYVERKLCYHENLPEKSKLFDGYWQSYKYLKDIDAEIRNSFSFVNIVDPFKIYEIQNSDSVFIHIRRGDYMNAKNQILFEECKVDYYVKAIHMVRSLVDNPKFFIFSNDINWVKSNFKIFEMSVVFVENETSVADFVCMQACKHAIIANSTFSWWAAWLINNKSKRIIAPLNWYRNKKMNETTSDLIPEDWIRI